MARGTEQGSAVEHTPLGAGREFDLIRQLERRWGSAARGIGDDAATLDVPLGEQLVVTTDTSVEDVHFRRRWLSSEEIGFRSAMAAISDVAAMGARPLGMTVALALPDAWIQDLDGLADGIGAAARSRECPILGGDLSRAQALHLTFTALGAAARPVRRSGARAGDGVYVTGALGGPRAALQALLANTAPQPLHRERFARPLARVHEGMWLGTHGATALIDISDGLVSDAEHLAVASGVDLTIDLDIVPLVAGCAARDAARSGEEYELLFTAPSDLNADAFRRAFALPLTAIGQVAPRSSSSGRVTFTSAGARVDLEKGYDHFSL
jgi:thiamine-monophosphate kinase